MNEQYQPKHNRSQESDSRSQEVFREHQERIKDNHEKAAAQAEHAEQNKPSVEQLKEQVEQHAKSKHDHIKTQKQAESTDSEIPVYTNATLRNHASNRIKKQIQRQLPIHDRTLSKVIHQPVIEAVSNAAEGTVARPSGLLFGGLLSLISSSIVLYICRHYGYEYNSLIGIASFAGGFIAGIILEMGYKLISIRRS